MNAHRDYAASTLRDAGGDARFVLDRSPRTLKPYADDDVRLLGRALPPVPSEDGFDLRLGR